MVASYSPASPIPWRPTARTLGALFAGSAVTLSATVMHGSSLLTGVDETGSITEPAASPDVAMPAQPQPAILGNSRPGRAVDARRDSTVEFRSQGSPCAARAGASGAAAQPPGSDSSRRLSETSGLRKSYRSPHDS